MKERMCYVGILPCGCILASQSDDPERKKEVAKAVSEFILQGLVVERKSSSWLKENFGLCEIHKETKQLSLL